MFESLISLAQATTPIGTGAGLALLGAAVGAGIAIIGAGIGIGRAAAHSCDATARQPEAGGNIFRNMIIAAAMVEGVALLALVIAILVWNAAKGG